MPILFGSWNLEADPSRFFEPGGALAQLGERLLCKQDVVGSIPSGSTIAAHDCCASPDGVEALTGLAPFVLKGWTVA